MLGYLGPAGTFTQQALLRINDGEQTQPFDTVGKALDAVRSGEVRAALVPIENSVEGGVSATLDYLAADEPLMILREVVIPVQFVLAGRPGTATEDVRLLSPWTPERTIALPPVQYPPFPPVLPTRPSTGALTNIYELARGLNLKTQANFLPGTLASSDKKTKSNYKT